MMAVRLVSLICFFALSGCAFNLPAPPKQEDIPHPVAASKSTLTVPIVLNVDAMRASVIADLQAQPLFQGRSPELSVKMLGEETSIKDIPQTVVVTAAVAAQCYKKTVVKTITEPVEVSVRILGCIVNPFSNCWKKTIKMVSHDIEEIKDECTPAVAAVTRVAMIPTTFIADKVVDTSAWVNYKGTLDDVNFTLNGNTIAAHATVSIPVSVDVKEKVFGASLKVKGAVACSSSITADANVNVRLVPVANSIEVKADVQGIDLNVNQLCVPGAVQLLQAWSFSSVDAAVISRVLKSAIEKKIQTAANEAVGKATSNLPVGTEISTIVAKLQGAYGVSKGLWLTVEPKQVYISQLVGSTVNGQTLSFTAGVDTNLAVLYGQKPVVQPLASVPVGLGAGSGGFRLAPRGTIALAKVREVALSEANAAAGAQLEKYGFKLDGVDVYQSGENIAFKVALKGDKFARPSGSLYLSGKPVYDDVKRSVAIKNLQFTVESKNWLLKNAVSVGESKIEELIEKKLEFKFGEDLDTLLSKNEKFSVPIGGGKIQGTISSVKMNSIWMQADALNVELLVDGTSQINLSL
jgi:hypothetical protein